MISSNYRLDYNFKVLGFKVSSFKITSTQGEVQRVKGSRFKVQGSMVQWFKVF
jgi:hypothetical protein